MASKLFVGGLPYSTTNDDLQNLFAAHGTVASAVVINDRETGRSKGFGFVEFEDDNEAKSAIQALDGSELGGRKIVVNEARPREDRPQGGGGGFRSGNSRDFNRSSSFRQR
jgi:RNA recognition motif-containing protein